MVLAHLYYEDVSVLLLKQLGPLRSDDTLFLFNVQDNAPGRLRIIHEVRQLFPASLVASFPAIGRDIGGKLYLIELMRELGIATELILLIHDKKSPHIRDGAIWRQKLYRIIEPKMVEKVEGLFKSDPSIGLIGSKELVQNEFDSESGRFDCTSAKQIEQLIYLLQMRVNNYNYIAGSTFWVRNNLIDDFFSRRDIPTIINGLERMNCLDHTIGTSVHAWERIFSWIANNGGQRVYGV